LIGLHSILTPTDLHNRFHNLLARFEGRQIYNLKTIPLISPMISF